MSSLFALCLALRKYSMCLFHCRGRAHDVVLEQRMLSETGRGVSPDRWLAGLH